MTLASGGASHLSRREFIAGSAALLAGGLAQPSSGQVTPRTSGKRRVAVVGAGAFGGWSALMLLRRGAQVTLVDAWGPGHARASSGGETRVIRATYGPDRIYVEMTARSLQLWRENQQKWGRKLFFPAGVLWMVSIADDQYERAALPLMREAGLRVEELSPADLRRRWPQIDFDGVRWAIYEQDAGYLLARQACAAVLEAFVAEGGEYREAAAEPGEMSGGELRGMKLSDGSTVTADAYVFACGPWLGKLFPEVAPVHPTRQEVYFFGPAAGDARYREPAMPVWADHGERFMYGIPGNERRGFKVADDTHGPDIDPTTAERTPTPDGIRAAREYLARRFPGMKGAPLVEARVCQYENSPDSHFILDRHPQAQNLWLVGGGSGHGYKHGPAMGERVAQAVLGEKAAPGMFRLERFSEGQQASARGWGNYRA